MQKPLLSAAIIAVAVILFQCSSDKHINSEIPVDVSVMHGDEPAENEDGIREAQEMEFEMTKDVKLGYIPKDRLIKAYENLMIQRRNGPDNSIEALSWTERGPNTDVVGPSNGNTRGPLNDAVTSGRMRAIFVDLADITNQTIWGASVSGGLWKTTNISAPSPTWTLINDFFGNLAITSICQNPANTNIMYFATGERNGNADAVRGGGIWKSIDNGVSWNLLANTTGFWNVSKIVCDAAGNVYVGTNGTGNGLQRSTNGGTSWSNITPTTAGGGTAITEVRVSNTGRLHVIIGTGVANQSGYFYTDIPSTVASATWTTPVTTFANVENNCELAVAGNALYVLPADASGLTPQIYKSTDGGANWAATVTSPSSTATEPSINTGQGWYDLAIGVDPTNTNIAIAGGLNFYRTTDGGITWTQITRWVGTTLNYVHADHHTVVWNGTQVLVGTDGGIFYSSNNGASFTDRNVGLRLKQFYACAIHPSTTNYFLAGTQDNGTHQLTSAGLSGSTEVFGGDGGFTHIDEDEPQYQYGATTRSVYRRSTNSGAAWAGITYSTTIGQFINPTDYDDIGNKMYTSAAVGQYVRWDNPQTGATFTPINITDFGANTIRSVTKSLYTANRVFFGTAGGRVVRVDNADQASPTSVNITGSSMSTTIVSCIAQGTTDNNLLATFSNYGSIHVWVSTTGGGAAGWIDISGNLPDIPVRWARFYPDDNTKAILATEMGIYETNLINGGATIWTQNVTFPVVKTNMLQYRYNDNTLLAATHGRGLWTSIVAPAAPYVRFASAYTYSPVNTEATTASGSVCRNYKDYTLNMHIDQAPAGAANVTLSVSAATATQGVDFDFTTNGNFASPSNILTFPNASAVDQPITIRVYNDAEIESTESFTLSYAIGGGTNAVAAPSSPSYTFYIGDNDAAPAVSTYSGNFAIGTNNTTLISQTPFRSNLQKFRIQYLFTAAELTAAGITGAGNVTSMNIRVATKNSTQPYNGFTISLGNTGASNLSTGFVAAAFTQVYTGNYSSVPGDNTFAFTTPFVWDGTSNVVVNFCFDNAPAGAEAASDFMEGTSAPLGVGIRASTYSNLVTGSGCSLGAAFVSDVRITATFGASSGNPIATVVNTNRSEYLTNNGTYYFIRFPEVISSITNASANLGCVTSNIFEAGNTWQAFAGGQRSQKVIDITPTTNSGASYTAGLYFTAAELATNPPASLRIAKTTAATMAGANSSNTVIATTAFAAFGSGYLFTASFTGFSKFFLVNANVVLPVDLIAFSGYLNNQYHSQLQWKTANPYNLSHFEVERSYDAIQFAVAGRVAAQQNPGNIQDYEFTDPIIAKAVNFYRLKMVDIDGRFKYSAVVRIDNNKSAKFVELLQNPVSENISFIISNERKDNVFVQLFSSAGQLVRKWQLGKADGNIVLPFNNALLANGIYTLRVSAGSKTESLQLIKQ